MDANISHFLQLWLSEPIKFFYQKVNANCAPNTVLSINLLTGFCAVEATISSYKISPTEYFDDVESNLSYYKQPPLSVTRSQYFDIIQRLAASESPDDQAWIAPGSACGDLVEFQRAISRRCSTFGYVSNIGQIAIIDDDVVRARSSGFENATGISLVNIPEKGMGAPQHVCVAMPSGFFLGGHFSLKGQGCLEAVKVILMDIAGPSVTLESHMLNKITNTIALDRGYQTEELINQLNEWGCTVVGTLKRCKFAPFSFGDGCRTYQHQVHLDKKGPRVDLFMTQTHQASSGQVIRSVAGVHRTGLGKAFMTHTTRPEYGAYKYTVTLNTGRHIDTNWPESFQPLLGGVIALTCDQRSPTWFILREFIFTSTSCYTCLRIKAKTISNVTPTAHIHVLDTLGITRHSASIGDCDVDVEQLIDISQESSESLMQLTRAQLVLLCQQRRLTYSGTKHQLAERLLAHELHTTNPGDITGDLLKCWFL